MLIAKVSPGTHVVLTHQTNSLPIFKKYHLDTPYEQKIAVKAVANRVVMNAKNIQFIGGEAGQAAKTLKETGILDSVIWRVRSDTRITAVFSIAFAAMAAVGAIVGGVLGNVAGGFLGVSALTFGAFGISDRIFLKKILYTEELLGQYEKSVEMNARKETK